jgi:hypothetical protein
MRLSDDNIKMVITKYGFVFRLNFKSKTGQNSISEKLIRLFWITKLYNFKSFAIKCFWNVLRTTILLERLVQNFLNCLNDNLCLHRLTYLLHWEESFLRSELLLQLIKKFTAFYGTRKFITLLTSARLHRQKIILITQN